MLVSKKSLDDANFSVLINQNLIKKFEWGKYLGVFLDNKLYWKLRQALQKSLKCVWNDF